MVQRCCQVDLFINTRNIKSGDRLLEFFYYSDLILGYALLQHRQILSGQTRQAYEPGQSSCVTGLARRYSIFVSLKTGKVHEVRILYQLVNNALPVKLLALLQDLYLARWSKGREYLMII